MIALSRVGVILSNTETICAIDCSRLNLIQIPDSDIGTHFGMLLENEEGSDVIFVVAGEKFHAHKLVLVARSPVFQTELLNVKEEDCHEIVVENIEPMVFKAVLHFIYRDSLIDNEELVVSSSSCIPSVSDTFVVKLLAAADRYDLARLRLLCQSLLCKDISVDSVANILALADRYHALDLKEVCLKFAAENLIAVMCSDGFKYLKENYPLLQSELLKTVAGCDEEEFSSDGGKTRSVWEFCDGDDPNDGSIGQQT